MNKHPLLKLTVCILLAITALNAEQTRPLKLHAIFSSHMVIQRDKPIKVWGWAKPGETVTVELGTEAAEATVQDAVSVQVFGHEKDYAGLGRWEVRLPAREASTEPVALVVTAGDEKLALEDILIGDVWVMSGQSNSPHFTEGLAARFCRCLHLSAYPDAHPSKMDGTFSI